MGRLIAGRIPALIGVLAALTFVVYLIDAVVPANPVAASLGAGASHQQIVAKEHQLGYDKPFYAQYWRFLTRVVRGDLGTSLRTHNSVSSDLARFTPATLELALAAGLLIVVLALVLGMWSASEARGSNVVRAIMAGLASAPTFLASIVLILIFYSSLHLLPPSGRTASGDATGLVIFEDLFSGKFAGLLDALEHVIMPALVVAIGPAVAIGRVLRGSLLEEMRKDHIRTARSKGLSELAVIVHHALRNAATPVLAMAGLQMGLVLTGVIVVETVFAWPGLGLYASDALVNADFPAIIGVTLVLGAAYVIINAIVDVLQLVADPRLREAR
ncbi:MAG: ABC transporter permease [Solirubrobacteraceae bacterium]